VFAGRRPDRLDGFDAVERHGGVSIAGRPARAGTRQSALAPDLHDLLREFLDTGIAA
jgi:hypothetical protein